MANVNMRLSCLSVCPCVCLSVCLSVLTGTFSSVYLARCRSDPDGDMVAIKNLVPTSSCTRIENEIYCLQKMG